MVLIAFRPAGDKGDFSGIADGGIADGVRSENVPADVHTGTEHGAEFVGRCLGGKNSCQQERWQEPDDYRHMNFSVKDCAAYCFAGGAVLFTGTGGQRSEERRVGKEGRVWGA